VFITSFVILVILIDCSTSQAYLACVASYVLLLITDLRTHSVSILFF